jgi:hypothetical protein
LNVSTRLVLCLTKVFTQEFHHALLVEAVNSFRRIREAGTLESVPETKISIMMEILIVSVLHLLTFLLA